MVRIKMARRKKDIAEIVKEANKEADEVLVKIDLLKWKLGNDIDGLLVDDYNSMVARLPEDEEYYAPRLSADFSLKYGFLVYSRKKKMGGEEKPVGGFIPYLHKIFLGPPQFSLVEDVSNERKHAVRYYIENDGIEYALE